jgi:hypothetical protein
MDMASAVVPFVVGILAAFVAYGRSRLAPIRPKAVTGRRSAGVLRIAVDSDPPVRPME